MNQDDKFFDLKFHELDVLLLLKNINPSKAAGPDGIHSIILKYCAASLAKLQQLCIIHHLPQAVYLMIGNWRQLSQYTKKMKKAQLKITGIYL